MFRFFPSFISVIFLLFAGSVPSMSAPDPAETDIPFLNPPVPTVPRSSSDPNAAVLSAIRTMPSGGRYSASSAAFDGLGRAVTVGNGALRIDSRNAQPSFCSGATYLVFLQALDQLSRERGFALDAATLSTLLVAHQRDGQGIWGRWNANGPGTARLFSELRLGRNFTDFADARPGDFMKIFWTDEIGQREHGHSVVFLGTNVIAGKEFVKFWSSNIASGAGDLSGYGDKIIPRTKIVRAIFSRLENPENIAHIRAISATDPFLAGLLSRRTTLEEVRRMCDLL